MIITLKKSAAAAAAAAAAAVTLINKLKIIDKRSRRLEISDVIAENIARTGGETENR